MKLYVNKLMEDVKKARGMVDYRGEAWNALNDIVIELSLLPDVYDDTNAKAANAFIQDLFGEYFDSGPGDIDGGSLQDMAEKHGILVPVIVHEPCAEGCNCAEVYSDEDWKAGVKCFRLAKWLDRR